MRYSYEEKQNIKQCLRRSILNFYGSVVVELSSFSQSTFICEPFLEMNMCRNISQLLSLSDHKINECYILDALLVQVFHSPRAKVFISSSVFSSSGKDMLLSEPSSIISFSFHWVTECQNVKNVKIDIWISHSFYMYLSKFVK